MGPKRKRDEPETITYGSEVPWLQSLVHMKDPRRFEDFYGDKIGRDPALAAFTNEEVLAEASKALYLLHHHLDNGGEILRHLGFDSRTNEDAALVKQLGARRSQWQGVILNKFFLLHVKELVRKWHVANAWREFSSLSAEERQQVWMVAYDEDPKRMATSMFKPVIGILDIFNTFNHDLDLEVDKTRMKAVRIMLRNKYMYGCEITWENRVRSEKKDTCFNAWVAYAGIPDFASTLVAVADMPITSKLLSVQLGSESKKSKVVPEM
ncbi:hypothetical protein K458DRAFT_435812 [Lentithecium fluviatile CBS 122367]|uniref:Uncharacterized protein n=1 Tax=Lentithecium fluviatile CBS 122367 TaxID=1168545 RepID=A0A6G1IJN7_9PLEO|nr:hypothetical protein K458DRAFT_435812 [Lentithecium fluviatile CBS 122367]